MIIKSYKTTDFRNNLASAFNDVQSDGSILINGQGRPAMVLTLQIEHSALNEKIKQLGALVKSMQDDKSELKQELAYYKDSFHKLNNEKILKMTACDACELAVTENETRDLKDKF